MNDEQYVDQMIKKGGPRSATELLSCVERLFGVKIPNKKICKNHCAPAEFLVDLYFEREPAILVMAGRLGGKDFIVALVTALELLFKPKIKILTMSATKQGARSGFDYTANFLTMIPIQGVQCSGETIKFTNEATAQWTVCSYSSTNVSHVPHVRLTDIELIHHDLLAEALGISYGKDGYKAQDCVTGVRKMQHGTIGKFLREASKHGFAIKTWCLWENLQRCDRKCRGDRKYGDCPAYSRVDGDGKEKLFCGLGNGIGRAQKLPEGGWFSIEDFVRKVTTIDHETFDREWLCRLPKAWER